MGKRIAVIQGHPSPQPTHLGHALADAYAEAAAAAGNEVRRIEVAQLEFPWLRSAGDWRSGALPENLREAQAAIAWADHLVVIFPLWTSTMPALLKAFLEQIVRPGFAFNKRTDGPGLAPALTGKSARIIVTMAMPALFFRWTHHANGVRSLQRGILGLCGINPVTATYIGGVDAPTFKADPWLARIRGLGGRGV